MGMKSTLVIPMKKVAKMSVWLLLFLLMTMSQTATAGNLGATEDDDPCCSIPHDMSIGCNELPYNFDPDNWYQLAQLFGSPHAYGGCTSYYWTELSPTVYLNNCGVGTIVRHFQATTGYGWGSTVYTCNQLITITEVHQYTIRFPPDASGYCALPPAEGVQVDEQACDLLAVSTTDLNFQVSGDACYKILRTYRVLNWCEYDGQSGPIIIGRDEDCDNLPGDEPVWVIRKPNGLVYIDRTSNPFDGNPTIGELNTGCGHNGQPGYWRSLSLNQGYPYYPNRGYYQYTQQIKVYDNIKPTITFTNPQPFCSYSSNTAGGCPGHVQIPFTVSEDCSSEIEIKLFYFAFNQPVAITAANNRAAEFVTGTYPNYVINGNFPIGSHTFEVHAKDGCGNAESVQIHFQVVDCKAPAPVCIHGISTNLMPMGPTLADGYGMELWALDLIASFSFDCSPPIKYSINRVGEAPNVNLTSIMLTCADNDTVQVEIYGWDSAFNPYSLQPSGALGGPNYDHCTTYIILKNWDTVCGSGPDPLPTLALAAGIIVTEQDSSLADVMVQLEGGMADTMMTANDGVFEFDQLPVGYDYEITPAKDGDDLNGLSTADLLLLKKHLLGIDTLDSPYLLIAADIDSSGVIDDADFEELRALVLQQDSTFAHNTSWRFVDAAYVFPDPLNPSSAPFPQTIQLDSLMQPTDSLGFVAIKIGDLNGSAERASAFTTAALEARSNEQPVCLMTWDDQLVQKGEDFDLLLSSPVIPVQGGQFALRYDANALRLNKWECQSGMNAAAYQPVEGVLHLSWLNNNSKSNIATVHFTARADGRLSDMVQLDGGQFKAEAYGVDGITRAIALQFSQDAHQPILFQNIPNPVANSTRIEFYLPEATDANLIVYSATGQRVYLFGGHFNPGYHAVTISKDEIPMSGVMLYTLETPSFKTTRRMVVIK